MSEVNPLETETELTPINIRNSGDSIANFSNSSETSTRFIENFSSNSLNNNNVYGANKQKEPLSPEDATSNDAIITTNGVGVFPVVNNTCNSNSSLSLSSQSIPPPCSDSMPMRDAPDGGWGWVIVFASFMISLISDGISLSSGTIFVELLDYFEESKSKTSWVLSIILSMPSLAGPIASYLTDRYGCKIICVLGAILASTGFVISFAATSLSFLYFTFTVSGFGLALCLVTSVVIVPYYFEKKQSLATGLSVCGTGIGTFLFPPLVSYLLENYGWRGAFLILAGFFLNIAVFGCLMRDIDPFESKECDSSASGAAGSRAGCGTEEDDEFAGIEQINPRLCNSLLQLPTYLQKEALSAYLYEEMAKKERMNEKNLSGRNNKTLWMTRFSESPARSSPPTIVAAVSPLSPISTVVRIDSTDLNGQPATLLQDGGSGCPPDERKGAPTATFKRKPSQRWSRQSGGWSISKGFTHNSEYLKKLRLQRGSLTYRGAMLNIPRYKIRTTSCPDIYRNSVTTISESTKKYQFLHDLKEVLIDMVDVRIFKNIRFTFFCISNFMLYSCVDIIYVYLQDYAITLGYEKEPAAFLISVLGILNTFGMIIVGYFGDKTYVDSALLYMAFVVVCGFSMALIPFVVDYSILAFISAIYGFTISANYTLMPVIVVNLISLDNFTSAYGMLLLIQGIASLIGPPIAGVLYDLYGTYQLTFLATGFSIILSGFLVVPVAESFPFCFKMAENKETVTVPAQEKDLEKEFIREDDYPQANVRFLDEVKHIPESNNKSRNQCHRV